MGRTYTPFIVYRSEDLAMHGGVCMYVCVCIQLHAKCEMYIRLDNDAIHTLRYAAQ